MWYGKIREINIWKDDSSTNNQLARSKRKEIQCPSGVVIFYMGQQLLETDINMLNLSVRSFNCLKRAGWNTIGNILDSIETWQDLLKVRNLGKNSAIEIFDKMKEYQDSLLTQSDRTVIIRRQAQEQKGKPVVHQDGRDLSELHLSVRSYNSLKRAGYNTVAELKRDIRNGRNLRDIRNLGATSEKEILIALGTSS